MNLQIRRGLYLGYDLDETTKNELSSSENLGRIGSNFDSERQSLLSNALFLVDSRFSKFELDVVITLVN